MARCVACGEYLFNQGGHHQNCPRCGGLMEKVKPRYQRLKFEAEVGRSRPKFNGGFDQ